MEYGKPSWPNSIHPLALPDLMRNAKLNDKKNVF